MKSYGLICAALALALGYTMQASAQDQVWLRDRRYGEGAGLRAGDLEIHPGVAGEFGYDSNYTLNAGTPSEPRYDTFRLRITPSLSVATVGPQRRESEGGAATPQKISFRAGVGASYSHFFPTSNALSDRLSDPPVSAIGNLQLTILPQNPVSADLLADLARTVQPSNNPDLNFDRFSARFGGGLVWTPGGGMFDWRVGYEYGLTSFEDESFTPLSSHTNQINTRGRWRFLPRTAFLFDGSASFVRYNTPRPGQLDSNPIRARLGLNGLVTSSFALLAMVGWGSSFYEGGANAQQYDGLIAQAELKWFITPNSGADAASAASGLSTLAVGYVRDFANSYLGDYYVLNRGYANLSYFLGGRFVFSLAGGVSAITYPVIFDPNGRTTLPPLDPGFTTPWIDATIFGEYRLSDVFGINATLRYSSAGEHTITSTGTGTSAGISDDLKWTRFEGYVGVRLFL